MSDIGGQYDVIIIVVDAAGKMESGVLVGNMQWLGSFTECQSVQAPSNFTGQSSSTDLLFEGMPCTASMRNRSSDPVSALKTLILT